jgi:isopenicillin N synthase-like dioxygenase
VQYRHDDWVPVIDLAPARQGDGDDRRAVAAAVDHACRRSGFLVVTGHGVDTALAERMYARTLAFFHRSAQEKERFAAPAGDATRRGFHRMGKVAASIGVDTPPDLCESDSVNRLGDAPAAAAAGLDPTHPLALPNRWPDTDGFAETWTEYSDAMEGLVGLLLRLFAVALDLPAHWFDDKVDHDMSNLGANYYPPQRAPPEPGQLRKGPHTDWGSVTILLQDDAGGLQVQATDGRWVDVPCVAGGFVVNLGDLMAIWTNNRWVSTMHRVVNPPVDVASRERLSIAFFHQPNHDAEIACIPTCTGSGIRHRSVRSGDWFATKLQLAYG